MANVPEITPITVPVVTPIVRPSQPSILGVAAPILLFAAASSAAPFNPVNEALRLARDLVARKNASVLSDLKAMKTANATNLDDLDKALVGALTDRQLKAQGPLLRRMIRFVRQHHPSGPLPTVPPPGMTSPGVVSATVALADGTATLHTDVTLGISDWRSAPTSDAYSLTFTSLPRTHKADTKRWLQFIWRMVVVEFDPSAGSTPLRPKALQMRFDKLAIPYFLTTDEGKPFWSVDSTASASAFYDEHGSPVTRTPSTDPTTHVMYDAPSPGADKKVLFDLFNNLVTPTGEKLDQRPKSVVDHFRAKTYLVDGMDVLCRADIRMKWRFRDSNPEGAIFAVLESKLTKTKTLDPDHRLALVRQFPTFDYFPGDLGVPRPAASFSPISLVEPASTLFDSNVGNLDRLKQVATQAHAELIDHVVKPSPSSPIGQPTSAPSASSADVKTGLNYFPGTLSGGGTAVGETGYVDGTAYQPKGVPANSFGAVPSVAITLAGLAFEYGSPVKKPRRKDFAIAVMRHEMLHAAHYELAILWLLKWRADFTNEPFLTWLNRQLGHNVILPVDYDVVTTYLGTRGKDATEALAYIEGVVTGLPWLEPPSITDLDDEFLWPASINELKGAGKFYNQLGSDSKVRLAVHERVRKVACDSLSQVQRDTAANWIKALRNPGTLDPMGSHHATVAAVQGYFGPLDAFLDEVLKQLQQPCPP